MSNLSPCDETSSFRNMISESWESTVSAMLLICVCCVSKSSSTSGVEQLGFNFKRFDQNWISMVNVWEKLIFGIDIVASWFFFKILWYGHDNSSPCKLSFVELTVVPKTATSASKTWTRSISWFTVSCSWVFSSSKTEMVSSVSSMLVSKSSSIKNGKISQY